MQIKTNIHWSRPIIPSTTSQTKKMLLIASRKHKTLLQAERELTGNGLKFIS